MKKYYWLLAVLAVLLWFMDSLWSSSVDMAHHYALVARLGEYFTMPHAYDNSLGEMNIYPHGSHFLAALLGMLTGSNLLGIHWLSLLSLMAIWGSLIFLVLKLPNPTRWWALGCLLLLLSLNKHFGLLQLHGAEIIGNYFFAQLVAQAGLIVVLLIAYLCESCELAVWRRNLFLVAMAWLLAWVHLLPVVELLGFLGFLLLADWLTRRTFAQGLLALFWLLLATFMVLRHPSYAAMLDISKNEGGFGAASAHKMGTIGAYALLILIISTLLLWRGLKMSAELRQQWLVGKYFIFYAMSVSSLCLLQLIAFKLGHGSSYAVRKYMFSVNTALLLEIVLMLAWYCTRFSQTRLLPASHAVGAVSMVLAVIAVLPGKKELDLSDLLGLERNLTLLERTAVPPEQAKFSYVMELNQANGAPYPASISYLFSLGIFKVPRSTVANDILAGRQINRMGLISSVLTSAHSRLDQYPACRRLHTRHALVVIDGQCWSRAAGTQSVIYDLSQDIQDTPCKISGFGLPEPFGRWTLAKKASINCTVPEVNGGRAKKLTMDMGAFLQRVALQRLDIVQNGGAPQHYQFDQKHGAQVVIIQVEPDAKGQIQLDLTMPDARSPASLGFGADARELGISIQSLEFQ